MSAQSFATLFDQFGDAVNRLPNTALHQNRYNPGPDFKGFHGLTIPALIQPCAGGEFDIAADELAAMDPEQLAALRAEWEA